MSSRTVHSVHFRRRNPINLSRVRWLVFACALTLIISLAPPARVARAEAAAQVPPAGPGPGPVDRTMPAGVRPDTAFPPDQRPPVVPLGVRAQGEPRKLGDAEWARLPKPGTPEHRRPANSTAAPAPAEATTPAPAEAAPAFRELLLRPGFALGDTSLVAYFDLTGDDPSLTAWRATLYDAGSQTEQASVTLDRDELARARCSGQREYCRTFGARDGWTLDPAREYHITLAAILDDGSEVVSDPSPQSRPRTTIEPPAIPAGQAAGCGCGNALGLTSAGQAIRAAGVNTATGAFVRVEQDLAMTSFGIPFASSRTYSSANGTGPFGAGWAWSYGMTVTETAEGAVVRAEDGAEAVYRRDGDGYRRPPGVRSNLRRAGDGWELVTLRNISHTFDAQGRLVSVLNPRGVGVRLAYTENGVSVTDASGRTAKVKLAAGLIREISLPDHRKVQFSYENSLLTAVVDARGKLWRYGYAPNGRIATVTNPDRVVEVRNEYHDAHRVVRQTDALGKVTTFEWRAAEQESLTVDADGVRIYDGYRGNVLVYTQRGNGDTENHRYDRSLNRGLVVNGKHSQHESAFDDRGNRTRRQAPQSLGFDEKTDYDARNNPTRHTDGNGKVWRDEYNEFDELVKSTDAEKHTISYAYDERGLLTSRTDQRGKVTRYEYLPAGDANHGLVQAVVSPTGRRVEFGYDRTGRQTSVTDPRGTVPRAADGRDGRDSRDRDKFTTRYEFDAQDRTVAVHQPGKGKPWRTGYDDVGRTKSQTTPMGARTEYKYFDNGLLKSVRDPRRTISYTYTDAGRRASARLELDRHQPDAVTTYAYNAKGLLHKVTSPRGNLPGANPADFTTTYFYDANDNPLRLERPYPGGITVKRDIGVDELDRTTSKVDEHNARSTFDRDNTGKVTAATDNLGRRTELAYDDNGRQTGIKDPAQGVVEYKYDAAGNRIQAKRATGGVTTWAYDDDGLLVRATEPRGNVEGADPERFITHYAYDLAGNPSPDDRPAGPRHHLRLRREQPADLGHRRQGPHHRVHLPRRRPAAYRPDPGRPPGRPSDPREVRHGLRLLRRRPGRLGPGAGRQPHLAGVRRRRPADQGDRPAGAGHRVRLRRGGQPHQHPHPVGPRAALREGTRQAHHRRHLRHRRPAGHPDAWQRRPALRVALRRQGPDHLVRRPDRPPGRRLRRRGPDRAGDPDRAGPHGGVPLRVRRPGQHHLPRLPGRHADLRELRRGQSTQDPDRRGRRGRRHPGHLALRLRRRRESGDHLAAGRHRPDREAQLRRRRPADRHRHRTRARARAGRAAGRRRRGARLRRPARAARLR